MLAQTHYCITEQQLARAQHDFNADQPRTRLNQPTGRFFYDPWQICDQYRNTVWEEILSSLPDPIGEARLILLKSQSCYNSHADIDNRYHLNIKGERSYLIDLDQGQLHALTADCMWYHMDASCVHTAGNFGRGDRIQLVVRQLLHANQLQDPVHVRLSSDKFTADDNRFIFDNTLSSWLNRADKQGWIMDFDHDLKGVSFQLESCQLESFTSLVHESFTVSVS